ncbi:hypothetical protein [Saccharothrix yanglingensis]|uniref:hypothetical protein n=1 Tax=Saccharothrix yanglingensis TaxID=659496 RepID=UPI0027D21668|nr:hypothetical protein [Saccharothrix yanglingensis]
MRDTPEGEVTVARRLHLATGFPAPERDRVVEHLVAPGSRLRSFRDDQVDLEISLKDRRGAEQRVTLECWINRTPACTSSPRPRSAISPRR